MQEDEIAVPTGRSRDLADGVEADAGDEDQPQVVAVEVDVVHGDVDAAGELGLLCRVPGRAEDHDEFVVAADLGEESAKLGVLRFEGEWVVVWILEV